MDAKTMTRLLRDTAEVMERLACGDGGMMDEGDTYQTVAEMLVEVQSIAQLLEDETGKRFTRLDDDELEDTVKGWLDAADKVAACRGE
jgi:hypothetical protein